MSESELKDKKLYSYKRALSQPYWIQQFNEKFSLKNPVRASRIVYFCLFAVVFWCLFEQIMPLTPIGFRGIAICYLSNKLSQFFSEVVIDGKSIVRYLFDYFKFYLFHGVHEKRQYINKGQIYLKPTSIVKRVKRKEKDGFN